jgi:CrcB protein
VRTETAIVVAVAVGSGLGGVARHLLNGAISRSLGESFPWGILVVNVLGSSLIGFVAAVTGPDGPMASYPVARQFWMAGLLGGFTTFSTFSLQTLNLAQDGEWLRAGANVVLSVSLCLLGAVLGASLGSALGR